MDSSYAVESLKWITKLQAIITLLKSEYAMYTSKLEKEDNRQMEASNAASVARC